MKILQKIVIFSFFLALVAGCETYKDIDVDHSVIFPMDGEWAVKYINTSTGDTSDFVILSTYGTVDNSTTQMWIRSINHELTGVAPPMASFTGKINIDHTAMTFNGTDVNNTRVLPDTAKHIVAASFTVTNGSIALGGYTTLTKGTADKISFTMTDTRKVGIVYNIIGFRRTFWLADEDLPY